MAATYENSLLIMIFVMLYRILGCINKFNSRAYPCNHPLSDCYVMYEWVKVEYDWPSLEMKQQYEQDGRYIVSHNLISGVKVYKNNVYVTVPRLRYTDGVPSTLNMVINGSNGRPLLRPFPNWEVNQLGSCDNIQNAMSMEIDPVNGHIYVIDPGRSGILGDKNVTLLCQPKLVVYDLKDGRKIRSHVIPENIASKKTNFLNDIVLDRGCASSVTVKWVYITDALDAKLYAIDLSTNETAAFYHPSMDAENGDDSVIVVGNITYRLGLPIDGLALSNDFQYLYYCALGSKNLYMVETKAVRHPSLDFASYVTLVGSKVSQTGGMIYATDSLFFGALAQSAIYRWDVKSDETTQGVDQALVKIKTQVEVLQDDQKLMWPDSFTIDDNGYMYVTACKANLFLRGQLDFSGKQGINYRIWKIKINQDSYLAAFQDNCSVCLNDAAPVIAFSGSMASILALFGILMKL